MLSRDDILRLLGELAEELARRHVHGHLFVVGGAAMAIAFGRNELTEDIDAVFEPKAVVFDAAKVVAERHGLAANWLNDAVKGYLLGEDPNATTLFDHPGLTVRVASARYMFVMKALAARVERDARDIVTLYQRCGFNSVDEALDDVERFAPPQLLQPKTAMLLREILTPE